MITTIIINIAHWLNRRNILQNKILVKKYQIFTINIEKIQKLQTIIAQLPDDLDSEVLLALKEQAKLAQELKTPKN